MPTPAIRELRQTVKAAGVVKLFDARGIGTGYGVPYQWYISNKFPGVRLSWPLPRPACPKARINYSGKFKCVVCRFHSYVAMPGDSAVPISTQSCQSCGKMHTVFR